MKDKDFRELLESVKQAGDLMRQNRIKKTSPKPGKYWCYGCDRAMVSKGQKCPVCGKRDLSKRQKI